MAHAAIRRAWSARSVTEAREQLRAIEAGSGLSTPALSPPFARVSTKRSRPWPLGVTGALYRTLCSTNPIENLQGTLKRVAKRVQAVAWRFHSPALGSNCSDRGGEARRSATDLAPAARSTIGNPAATVTLFNGGRDIAGRQQLMQSTGKSSS